MMTDIPDKAREAAAREIAHVCADNVVADEVARAALAAAQPHMGGEPVAWRYRYQEQGELGPVWSRWIVVGYDPTPALSGEFEVQPLYAAPPPSPDVAALIEAARAMSRKLATINGHAATQRVYTLAYLHGEPYDGPTYEAELLALDAALSSLSQPGGRDDH